MAIRELPIDARAYYKSMIANNTKKLEELRNTKTELNLKCKEVYKELVDKQDTYKNTFKINLLDYEEFVNNEYSTGQFYKVVKVLFTNRKNDYKIVSELFTLYQYSELLKKIYDVEKDITLCRKLTSLTSKEYIEILRVYYTEVHRQLIIEGNGYVFCDNLGWICVNRCILRNPKKIIDFQATKKREKELLAEGKRLYNQKEADWCLKRGIEYKAEDKRVYKDSEYCYEIPLINSHIKGGHKLKLTISNYRYKDNRNKSNEDLIKKCNYNINEICKLKIDLKSKLTLCDIADKTLYIKFIRNENQQPVNSTKTSSKDR